MLIEIYVGQFKARQIDIYVLDPSHERSKLSPGGLGGGPKIFISGGPNSQHILRFRCGHDVTF